MVGLVREVLESILKEGKSTALLELDDVVVGNQVGAASVKGSRFSTLGQGAGRSEGDESEKNGSLHFEKRNKEDVF